VPSQLIFFEKNVMQMEIGCLTSENHIFSLVCRNIHVRKLSHNISVPVVMKTLLLHISS